MEHADADTISKIHETLNQNLPQLPAIPAGKFEELISNTVSSIANNAEAGRNFLNGISEKYQTMSQGLKEYFYNKLAENAKALINPPAAAVAGPPGVLNNLIPGKESSIALGTLLASYYILPLVKETIAVKALDYPKLQKAIENIKSIVEYIAPDEQKYIEGQILQATHEYNKYLQQHKGWSGMEYHTPYTYQHGPYDREKLVQFHRDEATRKEKERIEQLKGGKVPGTDAWVKHVKAYAKQHNLTFFKALKPAAKTFKK